MIDTNIGPMAREDLEFREEVEDLPQGNKCVTRSFFYAGELVRRDIEIIVTPEGLAALGSANLERT